MLSDNLQRKGVLLILALLMGWAFLIRQQSIINSEKRSIDEVVYHRMAVQVQWGWEHYHTKVYGQKLAATGRELPAYFFRPLYKHPPMFTAFNLLSYKTFGITEISPFYVSLACGVLMIPLVYLIGQLIFGRLVGIVAAAVMTFDPIATMVSQKMWMDSMIGMYILASLYAFILAVQKKGDRYFVASGILSGFGALTKYTGILGTIVAFGYAFFFDRKLFQKKIFWVGLLIPVVMLVPWLMWNLQVYGTDFYSMQANLHSDSLHTSKLKKTLLVLAIAGVSGLVFYFKYLPKLNLRPQFATNMRIAIGCGLVLLLWESILKSFFVAHLPEVSWAGATFYGSSHAFYLERLLEWNLIFFFAMLSFFLPQSERKPGEVVLRLGFLVVLLVFTAWGAFQSRYIIAAVPLGIILGANLLVQMLRIVNKSDSLLFRITGRSAVLVMAYIVVARMFYINHWISYTNDMCYF